MKINYVVNTTNISLGNSQSQITSKHVGRFDKEKENQLEDHQAIAIPPVPGKSPTIEETTKTDVRSKVPVENQSRMRIVYKQKIILRLENSYKYLEAIVSQFLVISGLDNLLKNGQCHRRHGTHIEFYEFQPKTIVPTISRICVEQNLQLGVCCLSVAMSLTQ